MRERPARLDVAGYGLAAVSAGAVVWTLAFALDHTASADFTSYVASAQRWLASGSMYAPEQLEGPYLLATASGLGFAYTPPAMLLLLPFTLVGYIGSSLLSIAFLYSGLIAIVAQHRRLSPAWIGVTAALAFSPPLIQSVMLGSVTTAVTGLLAWAYVGRSGISGGLGGLLKVTPAAISAIDGTRGIVVAVIAVTATSALTLPIVGLANWRDYVTVLGNTRPFCESAISVACLSGSTTLALALGVALTISCLFTSSRLVRLALVTGALLATSMEIQPVSPYFLYFAPLLIAVVVERVATLEARTSSRSARPTWGPP